MYLTKEDLENQSTFFQYEGNVWYDNHFEFQIRFIMGVPKLSHHCEEEGTTWFIKYPKSLDDLKKVYEAITDSEFK